MLGAKGGEATTDRELIIEIKAKEAIEQATRCRRRSREAGAD